MTTPGSVHPDLLWLQRAIATRHARSPWRSVFAIGAVAPPEETTETPASDADLLRDHPALATVLRYL